MSSSNSTSHFDDPEQARRYSAEGLAKFIPGFASLHRLVVQLISEKAVSDAQILVLGAGGGVELGVFAEAQPHWSFIGIDPSAEMLNQAKTHLGVATRRVEWIQGFIENAPTGPFDAATCLLTLHLVPDDGSKLSTLNEIRKRLKPGSVFVIVDHCIDTKAPDAKLKIDRYARYALDSGVPSGDVAKFRAGLESSITCISAEREEALLSEAGFSNIELFFAGLAWRGWSATA
jgi:tRNA (cmo5U34)-methyltransferase